MVALDKDDKLTYGQKGYNGDYLKYIAVILSSGHCFSTTGRAGETQEIAKVKFWWEITYNT